MKNFLLKFVLFSFIVVAILATMGWAMFGIEKQTYYDTLKLSPGDKYIAIGDSRSQQSLDPSVIKGLKNMSLAGSQIAVWTARLRDLVAMNNDGVKRTIIIELNPVQFLVSREHRAKEYEYDRAILWMLHPELRQEVDLENLYLRYVKNEFPIRFLQLSASKARRGTFKSTLQGGFSMPPVKSGFSEAEIKKLASDKLNDLKGFHLCEEDYALIDPMVDVCRMKGWDIVALTFPICSFDPGSTLMRTFKNDMASYCERHHVRYIDLTHLCGEMKYWLDAVHVNRAGTKVVSAHLAKVLHDDPVTSTLNINSKL